MADRTIKNELKIVLRILQKGMRKIQRVISKEKKELTRKKIVGSIGIANVNREKIIKSIS